MTDHQRKRVLFLFSDTGGGHRSATEAIIEALNLEYPDQFDCTMVDFLRSYYPRPLNYAPEMYPAMSRVGAWSLTYYAFDGRSRSKRLNQVTYPYLRRGLHRLIHDHPADLIVSVHPLANTNLARAMRKHPTPFITVVTDMVSTHAFWFDRHADLIVVPTELAKDRAIHFGIPEGNLRVFGLPIASGFTSGPIDAAAWRAQEGWETDRPIALLIGGGDGMGPLKRVAKAINEAGLPLSLVVICGRNAELRADLEAISWNIPAHLYGFTREMPQFMAGSDILITKAGPGTISEGFISGLPIVLYSRVVGQEDGNVDYVVNAGAGVWAPRPREVVDALRHWTDDPEALQKAAEISRGLARPSASHEIAHLIATHTGVA